METSLLKKVFGQARDLLSRFAFFLFLVSSIPILAQQPNTVESFTTANGLGNLGCSDVLKEPNGTLWVVHNSSTSPYNPQFPISKRDNAGNWSYPDLSILPAAIVNGTSYISNIYYQFNSIFKASNGDVWFLPKHHTLPNNDFDKTPPVVKFDGLSWSVFHSSLGSFPNKGSVLCIDEDSQGNLWFGCSNGLVRLDNTGAFSTFDPPNVVYSNGQTMQATNINSITVDLNDHIVMVSSQSKSVSGGGGFNWSCVRKYDPIASTWADWHLSDAPWWNAVQVYYYPRYVVAMHDTANTVNVSTFGGGMYYIPSAQFGSKNRTQIANFLKYSNGGWGAWGWPMENVYTNLPDFTERVFKSNSNRFWIIGSPTSSNEIKAYRYENARPAQWAGFPATQYAFSNWESNLSRVQSGTTVKAKIVSMSFVDDDAEIWFATDLGVERWYADYPNPASDFIGLEGTGPNNNGIMAWNNFSFNNPEPVRDGHILVPGTPSISIDSAYYYIATRDYDNIDPDLHAGLKGDGVVQGFGLTQAALTVAGLGFENIEIRFTPIDLGRDLKGADEDWTYSNSLEKRRYQRRILDEKDTTSEVLSNYSILVNNQVIFHGPMPLVNLSIRYNKYGYLFDSIAGVSSYVHLTSNPLVTDPTLLSIQQALLQDVGQHGVRFQFRSIESANDESLDSPGRQGGFFEIHHAMLEKGTIILPPTPLAGKYIVGPSAHADYPDLTVALNDLHLRGLDSWVGFSLEPGTHSGQYVLGTIPGQQGFNHRFVIINSVGGDSSTVTLEYNPQHADSSFIFELKGIQQFKLQGLKFRNLSTAQSGIIKTTNASSNLEISQCTFMANPASAKPLLSGLQVNMNSFDVRECNFINGTTALSIGGNSGIIEECVFQGQTDYAIKALFGSDMRIANNRILGTDTGSFSGIHLVSVKDAFKVYNNRITNLTSVCKRGIFVAANSTGFAFANEYGELYNNEINVLGGTNSTGLSLEGVEVKYYHNTVRIHGGPQSSTALRVGWANQPLDIQRSIFASENGSAILSASFPGFEAATNNNIYYSQNSDAFVVDPAGPVRLTFNDLNSFAAVAGTDAQSILLNPQFISDTVSVPNNPLAWDRVAALAGFENDIAGMQRAALCEPGAYEFDSTYLFVAPPVVNYCESFGLLIEQNRRQLKFEWESRTNATKYRILRRPMGTSAWFYVNGNIDTNALFVVRDTGTWQVVIVPFIGGQWTDSSCVAQYTINCLPLNLGFNALHPFGVFPDSSGSILVRNVRGGTGAAPFDLSLWNTSDSASTWQNIQAVNAHAFEHLQGGTYVLKTSDAIGCYRLDTFHLDLNQWVPNTPVLLSAQAMSSTSIQVDWNPILIPGIRRYRVAYRNETDGQIQRSTQVVQAGQNSLLVGGLIPGKTYQFWVQARIDSGMGPQWGLYSAGIAEQTPMGAKYLAAATLGELKAYPNPFQNSLRIQFAEEGNFEIGDALGRIIYIGTAQQGENQLNTEHWPVGVYWLRYTEGGSFKTQKIIKQ